MNAQERGYVKKVRLRDEGNASHSGEEIQCVKQSRGDKNTVSKQRAKSLRKRQRE